MERVPDDIVDAIQVLPAEDFDVRGRRREGEGVGDDGVLRLLEAFVTADRRDAEFLVEGANRRQSRNTDLAAFAFPEVTGQDGVVIEVGAGRSALVSEAAFARLIDRLRAAVGQLPN